MSVPDPITPPLAKAAFQDADEQRDITLGEVLALVWNGRYLILWSALVATALGGYYAWRKSPIYQVGALVQIEDKKAQAAPGLEVLQNLFEQPTLAQTEIEILQSNLVLGRAVEHLGLDITTDPVFWLLTGDALVRGRAEAPDLVVDRFEVPEPLQGKPFTVIAEGDGMLRVEGPDHEAVARGAVGAELQGLSQQGPVRIHVLRMVAKAGQRFIVSKLFLLQAIKNLQDDLIVLEKGKQTNVLELTFEHRNPVRGAQILNEILSQYVRQNIERKSEEATKSLVFLQKQLPMREAKLKEAERKLNDFRVKTSTTDLTEQAKAVMVEFVNLDAMIVTQRQKRDEALRVYKPQSVVVVNLDKQLSTLDAESRRLGDELQKLPKLQQDLVSLMRQVQIHSDLYVGLVSTVQQLSVTQASEIGNARIVDQAIASQKPFRPDFLVIFTVAPLLGLGLGLALVMLNRTLHRGVEDPRTIETRLGLPVLVTIPHSGQQEALKRAVRHHEEGMHILALNADGDLATESLRSLRTSLNFMLMDVKNPVILVSGPAPGIGKSFVTANYAAVLASSGARVLLVDCDLRKGGLHELFGLRQRGLGLSEVLAGQRPWAEVVHRCEIASLDFISTGTLPPNPAELIMGSHLPLFVESIAKAYDVILFDTPPVLAVTDAVILAKHVGAVLLVVKAKAHPMEEIFYAVQRFEHAGIRVRGCIFNDVPAAKGGNRYHHYTYHYSYKKA